MVPWWAGSRDDACVETPGLVLREGQLESDGAVDERASPRPGLTGHCYAADFCLSDGPQKQPLAS